MTQLKSTKSLLTGAVAALALAASSAAAYAADVGKHVPITVVINQSPWYGPFEALAEYYEETTGNEVNFDVNPFPALLEKQRNSVRASAGDGEFDILATNAIWIPEFYHAGYLEALTDIDPSITLKEGVPALSETVYWDAEGKINSAESGKLMGIPLIANVQVLYYRADLYEEHGLEHPPQTWEDVKVAAEAFHDSPSFYGIGHQGNRGAPDASFNFLPFLRSHGGSIFADEPGGDYSVTINSPEALAALNYWTDTGTRLGPNNPGSISQGKLIQLMTTGKVGHAVLVAAAWTQMDNPDKSVVVGKVNTAVLPKGPDGDQSTTLAHFIGHVPANIPDDRKAAAAAFLNWFQTKEAQDKYMELGGISIRTDTLAEYGESDPVTYRWAKPLADSLGVTDIFYSIPQGSQIVPILELYLNKAIIGEISNEEALNSAAADIEALMNELGYPTGRLPDLQ
ncbi:extracellular solute-binding protein [Ruegeria hyattellae]|uniref:extracellular solute-binding protein n=1 Tax=Ruegeria hyattellae TaxID=3233337 RepID=UPI00355B6F01